MILCSRGWVPLFNLKTFRRLAGGHWIYVSKNHHKYWEQHPKRLDIPRTIESCKKQFGIEIDNVYDNEYFGDMFIDCSFCGSVGGAVDKLWKLMRGKYN